MVDEELEKFEEELDEDWGDDENEDDGIIEIEHIVVPGYTDIIEICAQYGITDWKDVCKFNKIKRPNDIKAGDVIIIQKVEE